MRGLMRWAVGWGLLLAAPLGVNGASARLIWDRSPSAGVIGYRIYQGGGSRLYTNALTAGDVTNAVVGGLVEGRTYYFAVTARDTAGLESDYSNEAVYTPASVTNLPGAGEPIGAGSGMVTGAFTVVNGVLSQSATTGVSGGGRAAYGFMVGSAGDYYVAGTVWAPNEGANSFYVQVDGEPTDPLMIWDIRTNATSWRTNVAVSWRGTNQVGVAQFNPKVWSLGAGSHTLVVRGREGGAGLLELRVWPVAVPVATLELWTATNLAGPWVSTNVCVPVSWTNPVGNRYFRAVMR